MLPRQVLHVHSGNLYGGVETALLTIARYRTSTPDIEHRFALCFGGRLEKELIAEGCPVDRLPSPRSRYPWTIARAREALRELLEWRSIDVMVCHMPWALAIFGVACEYSSTSLVFWAHELHSGKHWLERWARRRKPALVIANSSITQQGAKTIFPDVPSAILHYPVNSTKKTEEKRPEEIRKAMNVEPEQKVVLQVSRLERWKGHSVLLRALHALRDRNDWVCWLVGGAQNAREERYLNELRRSAAMLGILSRIRFLGQRSDVSALLRASDIFCQPNTEPEPFGIVFVEALLARLPIVTFAMGGAKEILNETCALLVEPGSGVSESLRLLLDSDVLRRRLGDNGPLRAAEISHPGRQMTQLAKLINQAYYSPLITSDRSRLGRPV
jgi:glycosyltransferase involved in cell wall biosynthesis